MPSKQITEKVQLKPSPSAPGGGVPLSPGINVTLKADPREEYVSAGSFQYLASYVEALPPYIDDLTRDFGDDLYDRMMKDPKVWSAVSVVAGGILAQGLRLEPLAAKDDPQYTRSVKVTDFCQRAVDSLGDAFVTDVLADLVRSAISNGNKVAEQVMGDGKGKLANRLVWQAIKVKPRRSLAFVVDVYYNHLGYLAITPGRPYPVMAGSIWQIPDGNRQVDDAYRIWPLHKFVTLTWLKHNTDPRGSSGIRPAYNPWWMKMQTQGEDLKHTTQFGSLSIVGETAPGATTAYLLDAAGNQVPDVNGNPTQVTPETAMTAQLLNIRNGAVVSVPNGAKIYTIGGAGDGGVFDKKIERYNREIDLAITGQTLATQEGQHQARASSETHRDILDLLITYGKLNLGGVIREQMLKPLLEYNGDEFGEDAVDLAPKVSLSETPMPDIAAIVTALAAAGYEVDPTQVQGIDTMLNLPARSDDSVSQAIERKNAPPVPPAAPNGTGAPNSADGQAQMRAWAGFSDDGEWVTIDGHPVLIGGKEGAGGSGAGSAKPGFHHASPEERAEHKIPPGWKNVQIANDKNAARIAVGTDEAGRQQAIYSAAQGAGPPPGICGGRGVSPEARGTVASGGRLCV